MGSLPKPSTPDVLPQVSKQSKSKSGMRKSKSESPVDPHRLPYLQSAFFASILEDTILYLRINMNTSNESLVTQLLSEYNKLLAVKYGVEQSTVKDELEDVDPRKLNCDEYKLDKLMADRFYLHNALEHAYVNLCHQSFSVLADYVKSAEQTRDYREQVLQDETNNRMLRRDLNRQIRQLRNHIKSATYDADCTISELTKRVEDAAVDAACRSRYVANWQGARAEQNDQCIIDKESKASVTIEQYKRQYDHETRVHSEIELLTNILINETLNKIEKWMDKYDKDIEKLDLKIQKIRLCHTTQKEKRELLEETIANHNLEIRNWQQFKIDRENARLYQEKMTNAAITVQAWWRGLLVRNQLGPYKPTPKRRGPPKNKKKN